MELKQPESLDRINFLREFTIELIYNSVIEETIKEKIEAEKIKLKLVKPLISQEKIFENINQSPIFKPFTYEIKPVKIPEVETKEDEKEKTAEKEPEKTLKPSEFEEKKAEEEEKKKAKADKEKEAEIAEEKAEKIEIKKQDEEPQAKLQERKPSFYLAKQPKQTSVQPFQKKQQPELQLPAQQSTAQTQPAQIPTQAQATQPEQTSEMFKGFKPSIIQQENIPQKPVVQQKPQAQPATQIQREVLSSIKPVAAPKPTGLTLGKLDPLLKDPLIQSIECPGPGQRLLIKKYNKISPSQIILTREEMENIITAFSMQARIPVVGGILKAVVGDLLITAIISNVVESRFVINRIASAQRAPMIMR